MERVILVGIGKKSDPNVFKTLEELKSLTETAGGAVLQTAEQRMDRFHPGTLIGEGKIQEIADMTRRLRAKTVIFDEDLSPAQQKNLESQIPAKILDRTRLILDIFSQRARTKEGELQVELAQLSYMLPRLTGRWRSFSQQVGGIGTRGPGERKLEYERRHINRRIEYLKDHLERIRKEREVQRERRRSVPVPQIAIIGYTNVGKSTLLNTLTKEGTVYADDKLFATLDPTTRRVRLPEGGWAVFTDTVGFIQKLPTALVAAFHSTLEEVTLSDCLVHILDATAENLADQKKEVEQVVKQLHADHLPRVEAFNKTDRLPRAALQRLKNDYPGIPCISARQKKGLNKLLTLIEKSLHGRWVLRELDLAHDQTQVIQEAYRSAQVLSQTYTDKKVRLRLRITPENWSRLQSRVASAKH